MKKKTWLRGGNSLDISKRPKTKSECLSSIASQGSQPLAQSEGRGGIYWLKYAFIGFSCGCSGGLRSPGKRQTLARSVRKVSPAQTADKFPVSFFFGEGRFGETRLVTMSGGWQGAKFGPLVAQFTMSNSEQCHCLTKSSPSMARPLRVRFTVGKADIDLGMRSVSASTKGGH